MNTDPYEMTELEAKALASTLLHMRRVAELLMEAAKELLDRAANHDLSKLSEEEFDSFVEATPALRDLTYGSAEYIATLRRIKPAIQHHYTKNRHHPEHHKKGVDEMTLFDLVEMFLDWKAAGERHEDGNIYKSIEHNAERFNLSPQLVNILNTTAKELFG